MTEDARLVLQFKEDFGERYVDVKAWRVPESDRYPEGIKYSMQYGTTAGSTILRYDNFPDHPGASRHHVHEVDGSVRSVSFDNLEAHFRQFKREVNEYGHDW